MSMIKKLFALTLVLAMVLSVAVFADFTDAAEINAKCEDSVKLLTAIGILKGYEDGTFRPEGNITRAEACKMIYVLRNGGEDDGAEAWKAAKSFNDVPATAWYAGYVAYCAQYGIVNGRNATTFDPNANVTSTELAKMLLCVAGFRSDIQGYTGADWAKNVRNDAEGAGMFTGYGAALSLAAPRQWAAKMFVNTINDTPTITYIGTNPVIGVTVGSKYLKQETRVDTILANDQWAIDGGALAEAGQIRTATYGTLKLDVEDEMVGKEVKIAYRDPNGWNPDATTQIYGAVETGNTAAGELKVTSTGSGASEKFTVTVGTKTLANAQLAATANTIFATATVVSADLAVGDTSATAVKQTAVACATAAAAKAILGTKTTGLKVVAYDTDGDGDLEFIFVSPTFFAEVSAVTSSKLTLAGPNSFALGTSSKITAPAGLAAEDIVKIETSAMSGTATVTKLTSVAGKYTEKNASGKYVIGGKAYDKNAGAVAGVATSLGLAGYDIAAEAIAGQNLNVYTDGTNIIAVKGDPDADKLTTNFAIVTKVYATDTNGNKKFDLLLANGTKATMTYDKAVTLTSASYTTYHTQDEIVVDTIYEYTTTTAGLLRLRQAPAATTDVDFTGLAATGYTAAKKTLTTAGGDVLTDSSTYFFVKYNDGTADKYKVMKAADFTADLTTATAETINIFAKTDDATYTGIKKAYVVFYNVSTSTSGSKDVPAAAAAPKTVLVTVGKSEKFVASEDTTFFYASVADVETGAIKEYQIGGAVPAALTVGAFYEVTFGDKNTVTFTTGTKISGATPGWSLDAVNAKEGDAIQLNGAGLLYSSDFANAKIYIKNGNTISASSFSAITTSVSAANNILYHTTAGTIDLVIFSADGKVVTK